MVNRLKRVLSVTLAFVMLLSCIPQSVLAAEAQTLRAEIPDEEGYVHFPKAGVTEQTKKSDVFYFGSTNLTVSEKDDTPHLLKICRGGEASKEASVTVKFGDYSAVYGENYTVDLYNGDGVLTLNPDSLSLVDFLVENADSYTEMSEQEAAEEEKTMLEQLVKNGGADIYDVNGNLISSMSLTAAKTADGQQADAQEADGEETADYLMSLQQAGGQEEFDSNMSDYMAAAQVKLTFAPGETEKYIVVNPLYSKEAQGNAQVEITLDNPSAGMYLPNEDYLSVLTIEDEDKGAPAVVSIADTKLNADGDTVTVTVTREGAINNMVAAKVVTSAVTAEEGADYQGVCADLAFPMGVMTRTFDIQLNHRYSDRDVDFKVMLTNPTGATFDNDECLVTILRDPDAAEDDTQIMSTPYSAIDSGNGLDTEAYNIVEAGAYGSAYSKITSAYSFLTDTRGDCPYNTSVYVHIPIPAYVYDGIQVCWKVSRDVATYGYIRCGAWDATNESWEYMYNKDCGPWGYDTDTYFFPTAGTYYTHLGFMNLTSSRHGKLNEIAWIKMYHMKYNVTLQQAEPLDYLGVSAAEEKERVASYIAGCSLETKTKGVYSGDAITITTQKGSNYAQLTGLKLIDKDGTEYDVKSIDPDAVVFQNGTSVTLTLTDYLLWYMGDCLKFSKDGGRTVGELKIKPVFSYVNADVQVNELTLENGKASFVGSTSRTYHVGDVISFNNTGSAIPVEGGLNLGTNVTDPTYEAVGYDAELYPSGEVSTVTKEIVGQQYSNGSASLLISAPKVIFYPRVSAVKNQVTVRVEKSLVDSGAFDTKQGVFTYPRQENGSYYDYILSDTTKPLSADTFFSASAIPTNSRRVANWQLAKSSTVYSGNVMYLYSRNNAQDNMITLTLSDSSAEYYTITGMTCSDSRSIATGMGTNVLLMACGAAIAAGDATTTSDAKDATFKLENVAASPKTTVRMMVYYNNTIVLKDITLGSLSNTLNVGQLQLSTNNGDTASITNIFLALGDVPLTTTFAIPMTGKTLSLSAEVKDGNTYQVDKHDSSETVKVDKIEKATKVNFLILNGKTYELKRIYEAKQDAKDPSVWKASISNFSPEHPDDYTYGDLIYVQLLTDRVISGDEDAAMPKSTVYDPMATGYGVAAGGAYTAQQFKFSAPISADDLMGGGEGGKKGNHFASFPIIGNLNLASAFTGYLKFGSQDPADPTYPVQPHPWDDPIADPTDEPAISGKTKVAVRVNIYTKTLDDGRLRLHIGVTFSYGNQKARERDNPFATMEGAYDMAAGAKYSSQERPPKEDEDPSNAYRAANELPSTLSGLEMAFSVAFGVYFDFVLPADDDDVTGFYWVGVGGYLGFSGNMTFITYYVIPVIFIPAYIGFSAGASLTGYVGATKDITQYLEDIDAGNGVGYDEFLEQDPLCPNDFGFNLDGNFSAYIQGFAGVGVCNVVGLRLNLTLSLSVDYIHKMSEWYPNIGENWGLTTDLAIGGQADLLFTSVPFNGLSVPLASLGFNDYFLALKRGLRMMNIVDTSGVEKTGLLEALYYAVHEDVQTRSATTEKLEADVLALYEYIYDHASGFDKWQSSVYLLYHTDSDVYDFIMGLSEKKTADSSGEYDADLPEKDPTPVEYTVKQPIEGDWTANDIGHTKAGFKGVYVQTMVENGYDNPGSQLVSIGGSKMALFFLADPSVLGNPSWAGKKQTSVLVYSIYDGNEWSSPKEVQRDSTNDFYPDVVVCGDELMVSWVSSDPNDNNDLSDKEDVIDLFTSMEIYTATYNIEKDTVGDIVQLTDDEFTDLMPQGVYDSETGDRAVYYIKTAIDTDIPAEEISLTDFVSFYSETTYSMVCYMLYGAEEGKTAKRWLKDYYYPAEIPEGSTMEKLVAENHGERYMPSVLEIMKSQGLDVITNEEGLLKMTVATYVNGETVEEINYIDPPITDLAVCEGYNGLAVYAYTVDMDQNMSTDEDKELFIQIFDFNEHKTYVPIRLTDNELSESRPKMVRSGNSTYLFWLYAGEAINYINVSALVRDYVDADGRIVSEYYTMPTESEGGKDTADGALGADYDDTIYYKDSKGIYRLKGSEREYVENTDSLVRNEYKLSYNTVTSTTVETKEITDVSDYEVIMDNDQNVYILWTQIVPNPDAKQYDAPATEVFASAMIKSDSEIVDGWSRPYQLTKDGRNADGVVGAVSSDGELYLAYNSYKMTYIGDSLKFYQSATLNETGTELVGNPYEVSPTDLMVATLESCGSISATSIEISNESPKAGETVCVNAVIGNTGLTTAKDGYTVSFYTSKNGVRGNLINTVSSSSPMPANGYEAVTFDWVVPNDPDGVCIEAVATEIGYQNSDITYSDALKLEPDYDVEVKSIEQIESNQSKTVKFVANYSVTNSGNAAAPAADKIWLRFAALYQSFEKYGLNTDILATEELNGLKPGETRSYATTFTVPAQVFELVGFDELAVEIVDTANGNAVKAGDTKPLRMIKPLDVTLNIANPLTMKIGETKIVEPDYGNKWLNRYNSLILTSSNPDVVQIGVNGELIAVGGGSATITIEVVSTKMQKTVKVTVPGGDPTPDDPDPDPVPQPVAGSKTDVKLPFTDVLASDWYYESVKWAFENGLMLGTSNTLFSPDVPLTRAMIATILYRYEDGKAPSSLNSFPDVERNQWYTEAVAWAAENQIVKGFSDGTFGPNKTITREQFALIMYRYAQFKGIKTKGMSCDLSTYDDFDRISDWAMEGMQWAVAAGLIQGNRNNLMPGDAVTRAQTATILYRFTQKLSKKQ